MATETITLSQFNQRLAATVKSLSAADLKAPLKVIGNLGVADIKRGISQGISPNGQPYRPLAHARPGGSGGSAKPLRDKGLLLASINYSVGADSVTFGSSLPYAGVHQFGATIVPKRARWLCIPLTPQAKRASSPRRMPGLSPRIGRRGGVMVDKNGVAQFAMVKSVVVPARPFLGFSTAFLDKVEQVLQETVERKVAAGLAGQSDRGTAWRTFVQEGR